MNILQHLSNLKKSKNANTLGRYERTNQVEINTICHF